MDTCYRIQGDRSKEVGIKGFFSISHIPEKARAFVSLCRPFTGVGSFLAGIFLSIFAGVYDPLTLIGVAIVLTLLQFAGQSFNQADPIEIKIDKLNGKTHRPTVKGLIKPREAFFFGLTLTFGAWGIAYLISTKLLNFAIILTLFAMFYTLKPLKVKRFFILNNLWQSVSRGFLPVVAIWCTFNDPYSPLPYAIGSVIMLWVFGAQTTKDFPDVKGDRTYNIRTLPVVLGEEKAITVIKAAVTLSFALLVCYTAFGVIPVSHIWLLLLVAPSSIIVWSLKKGVKLRVAENNLAWNVFYVTLGLWFVGLGAIRWISAT